ncbi:hypothetical protein VOLCADRAFT_94371 [Volvox carteri f. nagariensis]|uniref:Nucleotide-diphospho-sugar transferase domain-containing protein n=1 Tax=Volvox carteri f. nagariensis TaxID=3068 RepID=D8U4L8_VOLCA|nr:uncharacterized protein VOLCADRAFT_94371 [Volvox carteri f. nagariensis]EFJ45212.1 hypothetical protein VOLCADRAFT_94371 [Volvox carteri f. nagariensis]|eukprot:XP_002953588.1 hypothetical protein VOLCADRAFT_94371 [Volvox carteri f. nagariensis]
MGTQALCKIQSPIWFFLIVGLIVLRPGPSAGIPLINSDCNPDNGTVNPATIFTRAAVKANADHLGDAAVTIQYGGERRKWVFTTMADKLVAEKVLPITLKALGRLPLEQGLREMGASLDPSWSDPTGQQLAGEGSGGEGRTRRRLRGPKEGGDDARGGDSGDSHSGGGGGDGLSGRALSSLLVVVTWDLGGYVACERLRRKELFGHHCVRQELHELHSEGSSNMSAFHSPEFNALGYAKIKYLYDALSLGYDVMAVDADVLVLKSPLPFILQQRAQVAALTERCEVVDPFMQLQLGKARFPNQNIGVVVARSDGPVVRCVERWFASMVVHMDNPLLWDQEEFNRVIAHCASHLGMRWHSLDNRRFVSLCYSQCGCTYPDSDMELLTDPAMRRKHFEWSFRRGVPYEDPVARTCGPSAWADWVLAHFPCQGSIRDKVKYMGQLLEGYLVGEPRVIKNLAKRKSFPVAEPSPPPSSRVDCPPGPPPVSLSPPRPAPLHPPWSDVPAAGCGLEGGNAEPRPPARVAAAVTTTVGMTGGHFPALPSPPPDWGGRACYFLLGAGLLAAWNSLITATDYFGAVYPGWHTDRLFTVSYLPVCLLMLVVGVRYPDLLPAAVRIRLGYAGFTLAMAAVPLLDALLLMEPAGSGGGDGGDGTAAAATAVPAAVGGLLAVLVCVALVGACDGLCQGAVYGEAAQLPPPYMQALVSGTASSGLLVGLMRITSKAVFENVPGAPARDEGGDSVAGEEEEVFKRKREGLRDGTRLYFALAGLLSFACLIVYDAVLPRLRTLPSRGTAVAAAAAASDVSDGDHGGNHVYEHHPLLLPLPLELSTECKSGAGSGEGSWRSDGGGGGAATAVNVDVDGSWSATVPSLYPQTVDGDVGGGGGGAASIAYPPGGGGDGSHGGGSGGDYPFGPHAGAVASAAAVGDRGGGDGGGLCSAAQYSRGSDGHAGGRLSGSDGAVRVQILHCLFLSWALCGSLFLTYTVTLSIFPGFLAEDVHSAQLGDWYPILLITAFNLADLVGKSLPVMEPLRPPLQSPQPLQPPQPLPQARLSRTPPIRQEEQPPPQLPLPTETSPYLAHHNHNHNQHGREQERGYEGAHDGYHDHQDDAVGNEPGHPLLLPLPKRAAPGGRGSSKAVRLRTCGCLAAAATVLQPLRRPGGLLTAAVVRGCLALPAFLGAAHWRAPAWVMAALTAILGVTNGYLTTQVLTMGPSAVLDSPHDNQNVRNNHNHRNHHAPQPQLPQAARAVTMTMTTTAAMTESALASSAAGDCQTASRVVPTAVVDGCGGGGGRATEEGEVGGGGLLGGALQRCSLQGLGAAAAAAAAAGAPAVISRHSDAEVVEILLVISLVAGLNAGAYLGWLWLL